MLPSAREDVRGDADRSDQRCAANCSEEQRFGRVRGDGDWERRAGRRSPWLDDKEPWRLHGWRGGMGVDVEERVGVERRQQCERTFAQLGADECELGRNRVGYREAHAPAFGIRPAKP